MEERPPCGHYDGVLVLVRDETSLDAPSFHPPSLDTPSPITLRRSLKHPKICWRGISEAPAPLAALAGCLGPNCLTDLHLSFTSWARLAEVGQLLQTCSGTLTYLKLTLAHALHVSHWDTGIDPSDEDWESLHLSSLTNLGGFCFDLDIPLCIQNANQEFPWVDEVGIPTFLSHFAKNLPLEIEGVTIEAKFVSDPAAGVGSYVFPHDNIENALLQFERLKIVTVDIRDIPEDVEGAAGPVATLSFPRLHERKQLHVMTDNTRHGCC
ncbi:hypothetical protein C8Q80DRAFT_766751 [Daedaleopsis nitida]|nr:hypothetical protein C8Q80DRAFT_766751 [Daedaleopsis nitida]